MLKKLTVGLLVFAFMALTVAPSRAEDDDAMRQTLVDAGYGGLIGALVGAGIYLVSENDDWDDNISYIPSGAGVGILVGTAYGLYKNNLKTAATEVEGGKFTLSMPTVTTNQVYDSYTNSYEVVESIDLFRLKF